MPSTGLKETGAFFHRMEDFFQNKLISDYKATFYGSLFGEPLNVNTISIFDFMSICFRLSVRMVNGAIFLSVADVSVLYTLFPKRDFF